MAATGAPHVGIASLRAAKADPTWEEPPEDPVKRKAKLAETRSNMKDAHFKRRMQYAAGEGVQEVTSEIAVLRRLILCTKTTMEQKTETDTAMQAVKEAH